MSIVVKTARKLLLKLASIAQRVVRIFEHKENCPIKGREKVFFEKALKKKIGICVLF